MVSKISGTVCMIGPKEDKSKADSTNEFLVRQLDLDIYEDEEYPQILGAQFQQKKCDLLDDIHIGDEIELTYKFKGNRNSAGKVFTNIIGVKVEVTKQATPRLQPSTRQQTGGIPPAPVTNNAGPKDDLPF